MRSWLGWLGLVLELSMPFVVLGCDGGGSSQVPQQAAGQSGVEVAGAGPASCSPGQPCACPGQNDGYLYCDHAAGPICNCPPASTGGADGSGGAAPTCTKFDTGEAPTFKACGGEPFGIWKAIKIEPGPSLLVLSPGADLSQVSSICSLLPTKVEVPPFLLDLESGGSARYGFGEWSFDYQWNSGCSDSKCANGSTQTKFISCDCGPHDDCNISSCTVHKAGGTYDNGSWTRSGSTITLGALVSGGVTITFDYCVQGDTMQIQWGDALLTLEPTQVGGVPTACADRSGADCALGNSPSSINCHPACTGGSTCTDAVSESQCTNRQGCSWDKTLCAGDAYPTCRMVDYGVVPGCKILDTSTQCVGTAEPCFGKEQDACGTVPGCSWGEACIGGALECSDAFDCGSCNAVPGCACNTDGSCQGTASFDCTVNQDEQRCIAWGRNQDMCSWYHETCHGNPTPCSDLAPTACAKTTGCELQTK